QHERSAGGYRLRRIVRSVARHTVGCGHCDDFARRNVVAQPQRGATVIALLRQIPNLLTALRLACAPFTALLLVDHDYRSALAVFAFAGLTDALDGFLAKRYGLDTRVGAWLDPAADKLLMLASFLALTYVAVTPPWLTVLVLARDAAIVLAVLLA